MRRTWAGNGLVITAVLGLVACVDGTTSARGGSFKTRYLVARSALETGSYDKAAATYRALLADAGPLEPRLRLEYAHSLLRADRYQEAADNARLAAEPGPARLAALAVLGTAEHELALAGLAQGDKTPAVRRQLAAAAQALDEVLQQKAVYDPLGTLAERRSGITTALSSL